MTSLVLKIIACLSMLLDHIGWIYGIVALRIVGRIAFPIYAFLISQGFVHTKNVKKYILRLFIFALISEVPFDLFFHRSLIYLGKQNVFFTLLLGLLAIFAGDFLKKRKMIWLSVIPLGVFCLLSVYIKCDYSYIGVTTVFMFWLFSECKILTAISLLVLSIWNGISYMLYTAMPVLGNIPIVIQTTKPANLQFLQVFRVFSLVPVFLYNGEYGINKENKTLKNTVRYGFYLFYPAHLFVLYLFLHIVYGY